MRETNCSNTEGVFRIIQSIPSPKAEPFKRWLARVGYERIQEIEDPELATKRTRALRGGNVAGNARKQTEKEIGRSVVSKKNYLNSPENKKLLKK